VTDVKDPGLVSFVNFKAKKPAGDDGHSVQMDVARVKPCTHWSLLLDEELSELECATCGAKVNAIWALARFAREESRLVQRRKALVEEQKRWAAQSKTKCRHCGKFTELR
jgi:hypothetical protein